MRETDQPDLNPVDDVVMPSSADSPATSNSPPPQVDVAGKPSKRDLKKTCELCGKVFQRSVNLKSGAVEGVTQFSKRRFCSQSCAGVFNNNLGRVPGAPMPLKNCANCGKPFGQRVMPDGKLEAPAFFKIKQYCSRTCSSIGNAARRKAKIDEARA